jgi:hypothetical protein
MEPSGETNTETQHRTNPISRWIGVLFRPQATFPSIARRPLVLAPFLLYLAFCVPVGVLLARKIDWSAAYRRQMTQSQNATQSLDAPANQADQLIAERVARVHRLGAPVYVLENIVAVLAATFFFWLSVNAVLGAGVRYRVVLAIVCYGLAPIVLGLCYLIVSLGLKADASVNLQRILPTSVAYYLPSSAPAWLAELGNSIELLWLWTLTLISIGVWQVASPRISKFASFGAVFGLWLLWVVAKVGWAGLFGL